MIMDVLEKVKKFLCVHRYNDLQLFYKVQFYCDILNMHKLTLYSSIKCSKCGKTKLNMENTFTVHSLEQLIKIKDLVEKHGAKPYLHIEDEKEGY